MTDTPCSTSRSSRSGVKGLHSPAHKAGVAELVAEGWGTAGFRAALIRALVMDCTEGKAPTFDCTRFKRCTCPPLEIGCAWKLWHGEIPPFRVRPDAFKIDAETETVWVAEVNVTHHAGAEKWADLWDTLDFHDWTLRYVVVDRNGVRSEPFDTEAMFDASYGRHLSSALPSLRPCRS
jgi:hypothetical protein